MSNKYLFSNSSQVHLGQALQYWELKRERDYSFLQAGLKMFIHLSIVNIRVLSAYRLRLI